MRLGIDAAGAAITGAYFITGIRVNNPTNFYHNTVYIGGGPVASGNADTYAFYTQYLGSDTRVHENNLWVNARTNGGGAGRHNAAVYSGVTGLTSDYNVFLASGVGGVPIYYGLTSHTLGSWQTATGQDTHSIAPASLAQVNFVNATGDAASVDLRVQGDSVVESAGVDIPSVTDDYAGQTRAALTPLVRMRGTGARWLCLPSSTRPCTHPRATHSAWPTRRLARSP